MTAKRNMNVYETLDYLENLEVSTDDESDGQEEYVSSGNVVIIPSSNVDGRDTDEDYGDENELVPNNLNRNQLLANAQVDLNTSNGNVSFGENTVNQGDEVMPGPLVKIHSRENTKKTSKPEKVCFSYLSFHRINFLTINFSEMKTFTGLCLHFLASTFSRKYT